MARRRSLRAAIGSLLAMLSPALLAGAACPHCGPGWAGAAPSELAASAATSPRAGSGATAPHAHGPAGAAASAAGHDAGLAHAGHGGRDAPRTDCDHGATSCTCPVPRAGYAPDAAAARVPTGLVSIDAPAEGTHPVAAFSLTPHLARPPPSLA
jgi:hypothetical protein